MRGIASPSPRERKRVSEIKEKKRIFKRSVEERDMTDDPEEK
jgi:hypothetical protein